MGAGSSVPERLFSDEEMGIPWPGRKRRLVVCIDVGATHSAIVLGLLQPGLIPSIQQISHWRGQESQVFDGKVPSAIVYDDRGRLIAVGAEAIRCRDPNTDRIQYFKLILHREATKFDNIGELVPGDAPHLPRGVSISNVYKDYLEYLMVHTRQRMVELAGSDLWKELFDDIEIVLTHPNLWPGEMQGFLRDAAVRAGLVSQARSKSSVYFVEEAEAAARYCISIYKKLGVVRPGKKIMICDAGGSTLDVTAYDVKPGANGGIFLKEMTTSCIGAGGIFVDQALADYLRIKLRQTKTLPDWSRLEDTITDAVIDFEAFGKRMFKSRLDTCRVQVGSRAWTDPSLNITRGLLDIHGTEVENRIFGPTVQRILDQVTKCLANLSDRVDYLILTGGFGESQYVKERFQAAFTMEGRILLLPDDKSMLKPVALGALMLVIGSGMIRVKRQDRALFSRLFSDS